MNKVDIFFIGVLILCGIIYWIACKIETKKENKEEKRLENTPIEVYQYSFNLTMTNNEKFEMKSKTWTTYCFKEFIERFILNQDSINSNEIVLNTQNIVEAELVETEKKIIKPTVTRYFGGNFSVDNVYTNIEMKEREVK